MHKTLLGLMALGATSAAFAQDHKATSATYMTKEQIDTVMNSQPATADHSVKIVDVGPYNMSVGIIHRGASKDKDGVASGQEHHFQTENFIVVSGSGTMVTGGAMFDIREWTEADFAFRILNGPSKVGSVKLDDPGVTARVVKTGDIIVIPPGVFHGWVKITDHVDYLSIRPSDRVIPAGYVHPSIADNPDAK